MKTIAICLFVLIFSSLFSQIPILQQENTPIIFDHLNNPRELQLTEQYNYDWLNDDWQNQFKLAYSYEAGLVSEIKVYYWNGSLWAYDHREVYSYDDEDHLIEVLIQYHSGTWINLMRYVLIWQNNLVMELTLQNWLNMTWENSERTLISYDANDNEIEDLWQTWDGYDWYDMELYTMTYDNNNLRQDLLEQHNNQGNWIDFYLNTYSYDANDNLIEDLGAFYTGSWENDILRTYEYDVDDNLSTILEEYYFMGNWCESSLESYSYENDQVSEILYQIWETDDWLNDQLEEYIYEELNSYPNEIPHNSSLISHLSNHPNPFNPSTTISFSSEQNQQNEQIEIVIYNIKGQKVKTFSFPNGSLGTSKGLVVWNGTDDNNKPVSSGIYFAKLKSGKTEASSKMLLLK
ncbi:MAG: T9SS type A sorting domain-containing protein [Candidatus Cloacimonetes bacterium]|nr:T9SS type A sorting domain-containing protein [Candidatus Cloacimonadota bacterium]MCF7814217.1 T9SS type A sorting domain-containing protein [Candidatus Cloacimonadota bacterium]MCF7868124.1 T9SS type A sorting domain-containing protein [Candidatus Cloacimonadota bacterium]MCF7883590.1 T9SS type A sorting domain-containing protein [Candidatus Cloacimonadota bacterium]